MCGIWGGQGFPVLHNGEFFSRLLRHRGPDHQGVIRIDNNGNGPVWLGHTRLAVIDTRPIANQPMWSANRRLCIVFNGEIYNFESLRRTYCSDYPFVSNSDTEVLLALWQQFGPECLPKLRGIFAFAVYNLDNETTYVTRDPVGVKPIYYTATEVSDFAFASEIAPLAAAGLGGDLCSEAVAQYFYHRYVPGVSTIFEKIKRVPPGCYIKVPLKGRPEVVRYWDLPPENVDVNGNLQEMEQELDEKLTRAIESQLVADVPVGIFLSGGIDSSIVAALAMRATQSPINTFSVGFEDPEFDESDAAEAVAEALGTRHHRLKFQGTLRDWLPKVAAVLDEPLADPATLPTYMLSEFARRNVVVALSGDGADELFAGYKQYRLEPLIPLLQLVRPLLGATFSILGWNERRDRLMRVLASKYDHWPEWTGALALPLSNRLARAHLTAPHASQVSVAERLREDFTDSLVNRMLMKVDKMSMAHALEVRVPFLDQDLVELAFRLPTDAKVRLWGDKLILRRIALRYLPASVVCRKKRGFNLPISHWLRNEDADFCRDTLLAPSSRLQGVLDMRIVRELVTEHMSGRADRGLALYALLVLNLWMDHMSVLRIEGGRL